MSSGSAAGELVGGVKARDLHVAFQPEVPVRASASLQEEVKVDEIGHRPRVDQQRRIDLLRIRLRQQREFVLQFREQARRPSSLR
jgi:hypothetical protein